MKKLVLMAITVLMASNMFAQEGSMWLGGTLMSKSDGGEGAKVSEFVFGPEFGYYLTDKWALGIGIQFKNSTNEPAETETSSTYFTPFARYTFAKAGKFGFNALGAVSFESNNSTYTGSDPDQESKYSTVALGVKPTITFNINEKFGAELRMPNLLSFYSHSGDKEDSGHYFGINDDVTVQRYLFDSAIAFYFKF
jgi:outer membrane protein